MEDYRAVTAASEPPALALSTQMRVAAEMARAEFRGFAVMIGTEWQAEALRLEGAVEEIYRGTLTPAALDAALCSVSNDIDGNVSVADVIEALHHERGR